MKRILFLIIALSLAQVLSACGSAPAASTSIPPVPAGYAGRHNPFGSEAAAVDAVEDFNTYCEACHGAAGLGDGPAGQSLEPKPANLPALASQVGDDYLFWRISQGKAGTSMLGWAGVLNDEQIWQVVAYIRTLK